MNMYCHPSTASPVPNYDGNGQRSRQSRFPSLQVYHQNKVLGRMPHPRNHFQRSFVSSLLVNNKHKPERVVDIKQNGKLISIWYDDSFTIVDGTFHAAWLWVNEPSHLHPSSGQRLRSLGDFDLRACGIVSAEIVEVDKCAFPPSPPGSLHPKGGIYQTNLIMKERSQILKVVWKSGERSYYHLDWLARFTSGAAIEDSARSRVAKCDAIRAIPVDEEGSGGFPIQTFDYSEIMVSDHDESDSVLFSVLGNLMEHGAVLVKHAPNVSQVDDNESSSECPNESIVANLGRRLCNSQLSHGSLYGDVFHVKSISSAHNIAYTSEALPPHQDLTYYESKPFLQLLHCVQNAPLGADANHGRGESILIDAMAAAEELRRLAPDLFKTLCSMEATFCKQREGADMISAKPHIVVSPYDQSIIGINWSPPFEGPLLLPPTMNTKEKERLMDDYVIAYQAMRCLLDSHAPAGSMLPPTLEQRLRDYAQRYTWEYALKEGEILVFNNQRMLHGRRSISLMNDTNKQRHLIGCYTDAMDTLNHYRLLLRQRKSQKVDIGSGSTIIPPGYSDGIVPKNPGNGTRAIFLR